MSDKDVLYDKWLSNENKKRHASRLERLKWLDNEFGNPRDLLFHGDPLSIHLYEEAKWCYVDGHFLSCILLCQATFEHMFGGELSVRMNIRHNADDQFVDRYKKMKINFPTLCENAYKYGIISKLQRIDSMS
jgi:hypothetical protein